MSDQFTKEQIKLDADKFGPALNSACWEFDQMYFSIMEEPTPAKLFNNMKSILRYAIIHYVEKVEVDDA